MKAREVTEVQRIELDLNVQEASLLLEGLLTMNSYTDVYMEIEGPDTEMVDHLIEELSGLPCLKQ